jgi:hypothetical protein
LEQDPGMPLNLRRSGWHSRAVGAALVLAMVTGTPLAAVAEPLPEGRRTITLIANDGARQAVGTVAFTREGNGSLAIVAIDAPEFGEQFLSMRPFRCLADLKEVWCHLAYPYSSRRHITSDDLTDLEYQLLFLFKPPTAYGIDAWNGLYFKLIADTKGFSGALHEADFNDLAVPPDGPNARPIGALTPVAVGTHRFTRIEIR